MQLFDECKIRGISMNNDISEVFSGQWITHPAHKDWQPVDVFSRHLERKEIKIERKDQDLHILFRREFELKDFKECLLNISADDYYKLYINGVFVTQGPLPAIRGAIFITLWM